MARPYALTVLLLFPFAVAQAGTSSMVSAAPSAAAIQKMDQQTFRVEFDKAYQIGAKKRMDDLMRGNKDHSILLILATCESIGNAPNEVLLNRFQGLSEAWKRVDGSKFPEKQERLFAKMPGSTKSDRLDLRRKFDEATRKSAELQGLKEKEGLVAIAAQFEQMGDGFAEMGDEYYASQSYFWGAIGLDDGHQGKDADLVRVAGLYAKFVKGREAVALKDRTYGEVQQRYKALVGLGYGSGGEGGEAGEGGAPVAAAGPKSRGPAISATLKFEELKILKDLNRPSYYLDEHRQIWPAAQLKEVGSVTPIPRVEDGPTLVRESSAKIMIDSDGDGKGEAEWPTKGKYEILKLELGAGDTKRSWAVLTEVGRQEDFYQGYAMNLQAQDASYNLYFTPASAMVGEISGVKVQVIDDNLDGIYGSYPLKWQHQGLAPDSPQPEFDSMRVGKEKSARPFSEYVNLDEAGWHKLTVKNKGTSIMAEPMEVATGTLQLKVKGVKPDFFIIQGTGPQYSNTYIDIAGGKKVEVPIGRYSLSFGMVRKGKKMQLAKAVILPTSETPLYNVKDGENLVVEIGAPYTFDFTYVAEDGKVKVSGDSIRIVGAGGESYDRFYNAVPWPEAFVRKKGGKRSEVDAKMKAVVDNGGLAKYGWAKMWKPIDAELAMRHEEVEVQLIEKKHKLFGKVLSDWR